VYSSSLMSLVRIRLSNPVYYQLLFDVECLRSGFGVSKSPRWNLGRKEGNQRREDAMEEMREAYLRSMLPGGR
jgi:hypothetical protein